MTSLLPKHQPSWLPWLICITGSLFFFYEFIQMNMLNSLGMYISAEYNINATQLGILSSWYFYANLLCIPLAGTLLDRVSTKKLILAAMVVCTLGTLLFSFSHSMLVASLCRFFTGMGSAFCLLSAVKLASRWFDPRRMAMITGFVVTMAMLGGMVAQTPMTVLALKVGWRQTLWLDAGLGLLITLLIILIVKDCPPGSKEAYKDERSALKTLGFWQAKRIAFGNVRNWLTGLFTCFLNQPISLLGALWGNTYLQNVYHLSTTDASYVTSMVFFGTVIGSPLAGWLSDSVGRRKLPMIIGTLLSLAIVLSLILVSSLSVMQLIVLFFLLGLVSSVQIIGYPFVAESNPKILTATAVSTVSFTCIGGYAVFQPLFGRIMDWHWSLGARLMKDGVPIYSPGDYQFAVWILPITFVLALAATLALKETYCKTL